LSLLADLLSKIKHKEQEGAIPPNLAQIVQRASGKQKVETRIKVILLVALLLVACGFGTIYFTNKYLKSVSPTLIANRVQERENIRGGDAPEVEERASAIKTTTVVQPPGVGPVKKLNEEKASVNPSPALEEIPKQENKKPFLLTDAVRDRQQRDNTASTPVGTIRKAPQSQKSGKVSDLDDTSKNEKDVALYTARSYEQNNNYGQAITHYKKALEKDPGNYLIMNSLANVLIKTGSFKESIQYSMDALTVQKNYVPSFVNLGVANTQLGNMTEGEIYLLKAKAIEPSNKTVLFNLGLLYEKTSNYRESLAAFQRLTDMKDTGGYLGVARVLEKQGNRVEAEKRYKEILSMDNIDPAIRQLVNERLQIIGNR
jgi:tetratricopeptide (TPR) repeat protein